MSRQGSRTAHGYTIPGGLTQRHLIGKEILDVEGSSCVLPIEGELGCAETALPEPWACLLARSSSKAASSPRGLFIIFSAEKSEHRPAGRVG